jgi:hypothetical protein
MGNRIKLFKKYVDTKTRIFTLKELLDMQIDYVESGILLNITYAGKDLPTVSQKLKNVMSVVNYIDCSKIIILTM